MKKIRILLSLVWALAFTLSCENEEVLIVEESVQEWVKKEHVSLQAINKKRELELKVNWDSTIEIEKEGILFQEYTIKDSSKDQYKLIGITKEDRRTEYYVLLLIPSSNYDENMSYSKDMKGFSGTINWFDTKGDIVALEAYEKGTRINLIKSKDGKNSGGFALRSNDCGNGTAWKNDLNSHGKITAKGECQRGFYADVVYFTWTDWYYDRGSLGWEYAYRTDEKKTYAKEWVSKGRDYADATGGSIGGVKVRYGDKRTNRIVTDIGTIERIQADMEHVQNPLFFVHCGSFDYYKPPGSQVTVAAVEGISETFFSFIPNGILDPDRREVTIIIPEILYFILPAWRRNGQAANITARAFTAANRATEGWFLLNPKASSKSLQAKWESNIRESMKLIQGSVSTKAPFLLKNPSVFQTSLISSGNCD